MEFTGTIENGMDLMQLGMILGLFKRKDEVKKTVPEIEFSSSKK
jgi:hypothetical protein